MQHQAAHSEGVAQLRLPHRRGNLTHLVSLHVDAPEDSETTQLVIQRLSGGPPGPVGVAQHGLVLEEGAVSLQSAGEVVDVGAAQAVAAARGSDLLAVGAAHRLTATHCELHVDEGACLRLVHLGRPQGTV